MDPVEFLAMRWRELDLDRFPQVGWIRTVLQRPWREIEPGVRNMSIEDARRALQDLAERTGCHAWAITENGGLEPLGPYKEIVDG